MSRRDWLYPQLPFNMLRVFIQRQAIKPCPEGERRLREELAAGTRECRTTYMTDQVVADWVEWWLTYYREED